jgi:hypothetical protein
LLEYLLFELLRTLLESGFFWPRGEALCAVRLCITRDSVLQPGYSFSFSRLGPQVDKSAASVGREFNIQEPRLGWTSRTRTLPSCRVSLVGYFVLGTLVVL